MSGWWCLTHYLRGLRNEYFNFFYSFPLFLELLGGVYHAYGRGIFQEDKSESYKAGRLARVLPRQMVFMLIYIFLKILLSPPYHVMRQHRESNNQCKHHHGVKYCEAGSNEVGFVDSSNPTRCTLDSQDVN